MAGNVYVCAAGALDWRDLFTRHPVQSLQAVWVDPSGGVWAVGGNVLTPELDRAEWLSTPRGLALTAPKTPLVATPRG